MKTRLLLNLLLLSVVLALAALVVYEPGVEEPQVVHLTDLDESTIDHIVLENKEVIVFEKREGHWWLTAPFSAPANEIRMRQLLDIANAESEARYPFVPEDQGKYELDKPKAKLTLGKVTLIFGGSDPIDMRRYVWVGDTLHLVNDDFSHHLTAPATDYVDKKLLPDDAHIQGLLLPGIKADKSADGHWTIEPSSEADAGISDLVMAWQTARAIDVKRLDQPAQGDIARIGFSDHGPVEFVILQREPDLVLARPDWGLKYVVATDMAKSLLALQKPQPSPSPGASTGQEEEGEDEDDGSEPTVEGEAAGMEEEMETEGEDVE